MRSIFLAFALAGGLVGCGDDIERNDVNARGDDLEIDRDRNLFGREKTEIERDRDIIGDDDIEVEQEVNPTGGLRTDDEDEIERRRR